jgi:type 1 glutamine amidotransferase
VFPLWADTLGSQFVAHPPIQPYRVDVTAPEHWLVAGIEPFETDDELYLSEYHDRAALVPLLHTTWQGEATGFIEADWTETEPTHLVMYLRELGDGAVLYNTLGHCRGHYDMVPVLNYYPRIERCSWDVPAYHELLRRSIRWACGATA